jgi:hypothetical protein
VAGLSQGRLGGRKVPVVDWDVEELDQMKAQILENDELAFKLNGWPKEVGEINVIP